MSPQNQPEGLPSRIRQKYGDDPFAEGLVELLSKPPSPVPAASSWKNVAIASLLAALLSLTLNIAQSFSAAALGRANDETKAAVSRLNAAIGQLEAATNQTAGTARTIEEAGRRTQITADAVSTGATALNVQLRSIATEATRLEELLRKLEEEGKRAPK